MCKLPKKLQQWLDEPPNDFKCLTAAELTFIKAVQIGAAAGVGYGFMQQVIEWEWQDAAERYDVPGTAWGPEYFQRQIAELEAKLEMKGK